MTKLIDLFTTESKRLYHSVTIKDIQNNENHEPHIYLYPDSKEALNQRIKNDSQLDPKAVSVDRDRIRIKLFQSSLRGQKFVDIQKK